MFFLAKKILSALILPPTGLILLALLGIYLCHKYPRTGRTLSALSLTILLFFSLPITSNTLLQSLESTPPITPAQRKDIQAIVILGGGKNNNAPEYGGEDTINQWTLERLRYGAHLQKQTDKPILVSGGAPYGGRPEADAMAESLKQDFQTKIVWVENQSKDTEENAAYSSAILKKHDIIHIALISQAWHLPRAKMHFEKHGFIVTLAGTGYTTLEPHPITEWLPDANALAKSSIAVKEYLATLVTFKIYHIGRPFQGLLNRPK